MYTNANRLKYTGLRWLVAALIFSLSILLFYQVAFSIAKGYLTDDDDLLPGMVVALSESGTADQPKVERAALDKDSKVIGVTTELTDEAVVVASGESLVYVQNTGEANVYTSDLNGPVDSGDLLAPSPILGILMKADESTAPIVGIALENLDSVSLETKTITENDSDRDIQVGKVKINLDHMAASNQQANTVDSSLERLGRAVVGKNVNELQVVAALVIFLAVLMIEGGVIYGSVSSSINAIGRNPLARKIIQREMLKVLLIAVMVLAVGVLAIYIILWA